MKKGILTIVGISVLVALAQQVQWVADKSHSRIGFKIAHMGISQVAGEFTDWNLTVTTEGEDFTTAKVRLEINAASINTNNEKRDAHLRQCDFLCVEKYPKIIFESTKITPVKGKDNEYILEGNLTMKGKTHPVKLTLIHHGTVRDPWGNTRAGFTVKGTIDRFKWDVSYNKTLETGVPLVGREVELDTHIELIKKS
ncbi:MAG: YceI family protein [Chlorobi bacterium]|nr:YceI family protein [Chlorobiota bacterium]